MASVKIHGLSEVHGDEVPDSHSFWDILIQGVAKNPQGVAVASLYQPADHLSFSTPNLALDADYSTWTYTDLQKAAERLAVILHDNGVHKGSVVAVFVHSSIEWCLLLWTCARLAACFAPLNINSVSRPEELEHVFGMLHPDAVFVQDQVLATRLDQHASTSLDKIGLKVICDSIKDGTGKRWITLKNLWDKPSRAQSSPNSEHGFFSNDPAVLLFTSGTSSLPKACVHTSQTLNSSTYEASQIIETDKRFLFNFRNFHVAALTVLSLWRAGGMLLIASKEFDVEAFVGALQSHAVTHISATPGMIQSVLSHPELKLQTIYHVKSLMLGAEMVSPSLLNECKQKLNPERIGADWGMTEGLGLLGSGPKGSVFLPNGTPSVGKILPGSRLRICKLGTRNPVK